MMKFFHREIIFYFFVFVIIFISDTKENYSEIDLKLKKEESFNTPLYIETNDSCSKWVPALFAPILIINTEISGRYKNHNYVMNFENKASIKEIQIAFEMEILSGQVSIFNEIFLARTEKSWPQICQFGLGYSNVIPEDTDKNFNALKGLIESKKIEKNIFSFEKWDINGSDEFISSKLFIGDSHEDFLEDNVGNCTIRNETGDFGCIFNDFIFLNDTYSLINEENNNKPYIIYFSSEFNKIYFPNSFASKMKKCHFEETPEQVYICPDLENKDYLPLKIRSDNMNITIEVDNVNRFFNFYTTDGIANIYFHDYDYIIFPLSMFKNFHVQFDAENNLIQFYTNDTSLLEVPKKEEPDTTSNPESDDSQNNNEEPDGISTGLLVFLIILSILLIGGLAYGGFLLYKRNHSQDIEKRFNKYSKFEDEDINENKVVF